MGRPASNEECRLKKSDRIFTSQELYVKFEPEWNTHIVIAARAVDSGSWSTDIHGVFPAPVRIGWTVYDRERAPSAADGTVIWKASV